MKTTAVDARSSDKMRRIELEEDYQTGSNLTNLQVRWKTMFSTLEDYVYRRRALLEHMVIGFRAGRHGKKNIKSINPEKPIVRVDQVVVGFMNPIDAKYWAFGNPYRRYRLNYMEGRIRRVPDGGQIELWASPSDEVEKSIAKRMPQKDMFKRPIQDHYRFDLHEYDPHQLVHNLQLVGDKLVGEDSSYLLAPVGGKFELVRDQSHCNVLIDGFPMFRILAEDAKEILTHAQNPELAEIGSTVKQGTRLIQLQERTFYGSLKFYVKDDEPKPEIDWISGDVFAATKRPHSDNVASFHLSIEMMQHLVWAVDNDPSCPEPMLMNEWAPQHLLEFNAEDVWTFPLCDKWETTPDMKDQLLHAVSPKGDFYIRADVESPTTFKGVAANGNSIQYGDGSVQPLPAKSRVLDSLQPGSQVMPGSPVADWVPREFHGWDYLESLPYLGLLTQHFLQERATRPGTHGYNGSGLLLPVSLIPDGIREVSTCTDYLDFSRSARYAVDGMIIGPPMKQSDWTDFVRSCDGIMYNAQPVGDMLMSKPIVTNGRTTT